MRQRGSRRSSSSNSNSSRRNNSRSRRNSSSRGAKKGDRSSPHLKVYPSQHHRRRKSPENRKKICRCTALQPQRGSFRGHLPRFGQSRGGRMVWWRLPV